MERRSITHSTFVIERSFPATPERVFAAFTDPVEKGRWFSEGDGFGIGEEVEMDFRVGGIEPTRFNLKDASPANGTGYHSLGRSRRAMFAYTMSVGNKRVSASLATVELVPTNQGTDLIFTEQAAFFEVADGAKMREVGWREVLDKLGRELARNEPYYGGDQEPCLGD